MPSLTSFIIASFLSVPALSHPTHSHRHVHHPRWEHKPTPTVEIRDYDFDHNGVPDLCTPVEGNQVKCQLADGQYTTVAAQPTVPTTAVLAQMPKGRLPAAKDFQAHNGTKDSAGKGWSVTRKGHLQFTGPLGQMNLSGDKARTGVLGGKVIWDFGDMFCPKDNVVSICGFDMGPAFYGTSDVMVVDTKDISDVTEATFVKPFTNTNNFFAYDHSTADCSDWGMDNSNVAPLNDTHGIVYSWEMWRGCKTLGADQKMAVDRGLAASVVTLGEKFPKAERVSGLLAGADHVASGMLGIMSAEGYIYSYTVNSTAEQANHMIVGRAKVNDPNIYSKAESYEFFHPPSGKWVQGIPKKADSASYSLVTAQPGGWGCLVYGSVMYSNYFNKYMLFCNNWMNEFNFYLADRPEGPWSEQYQLFNGLTGYYGAHVHAEYSEGGSHKSLYVSMGPNSFFDVWKVDFDYDV